MEFQMLLGCERGKSPAGRPKEPLRASFVRHKPAWAMRWPKFSL